MCLKFEVRSFNLFRVNGNQCPQLSDRLVHCAHTDAQSDENPQQIHFVHLTEIITMAQ